MRETLLYTKVKKKLRDVHAKDLYLRPREFIMNVVPGKTTIVIDSTTAEVK